MDIKISTLIIPAAGIGSRFLPITKSIPKEMLPLSNKPAIQYIVQEGIDADMKNILIVLSPEKDVIKNYFSPNSHLEAILAQQGKSSCLDELNHLIAIANFQYFTQSIPKGLADALMHAKSAIKSNEFFAIALPDDIIFGSCPEIQHLAKVAIEHQAMVIGVLEVPFDQISAYGVIAPGIQITPDIFEVDLLVEKPRAADAPSNLAIVGRYIFNSCLFDYIPLTPAGTNGEILLPETINLMIKNGHKVLAVKIKGQRFDTGTPTGWLDFIIKHNG